MLVSIDLLLLPLAVVVLSFAAPTVIATSNVAAATIEADGTVSEHEENNHNNDSMYISNLIQSLPTDKFYINGTWVSTTSSTSDPSYFDVVDPSTGNVVAKVASGSPEDINAAVQAAKEAQKRWSYHTAPEERQRLVKKLIGIYSSRTEEMARLVSTEMGSPIAAARSSHVLGGLGNIKSALQMMVNHFEFERSLPNIHPERGQEQHTTILYDAVGVVGMITPWNWPLNQITLVRPALLASSS
jgi:aldehyde dehydrogenase (NAD+)